jgi:hypothetical protein
LIYEAAQDASRPFAFFFVLFFLLDLDLNRQKVHAARTAGTAWKNRQSNPLSRITIHEQPGKRRRRRRAMPVHSARATTIPAFPSRAG